MSGTLEGGLKTAQTNYERQGKDYYIKIGRKGGLVNHRETRYFALHPEIARTAGRKGGLILKRGKVTKDEE